MNDLEVKKNYSLKPLYLAIGLVLSPQLSAAEQEVAKAEENTVLKPITVTTTKTERKLADVPVRTEVVTKEEIEKTHAKDLAEALRYVPGLQLEPNLKNGQNVWIQGFDGERVLVLVDGNPVSPSLGSSVDVTQIAIGDIERIEIIKGAMSALYGSSAIGGVVNVITKEPEHKYHAKVDVSGGSWGDQNYSDGLTAKRYGQVDLATRQKDWYLQVIGQATDSDGYTTDKDDPQMEGWKGTKRNFSAKFNYQFDNDIELTLSPRIYREDVENSYESFSMATFQNELYVKQDITDTNHLSGSVQQTLKNGDHWKIRAMIENYYNESITDQVGSSVVETNRETDTSHREVGFQYDLGLGESHLVTFGFDLKQDEMNVDVLSNGTTKTTEVDNKSYLSREAFIQDSWQATSKLEFLPGVRVTDDDDFGTNVSPMLSAIYRENNWLPGQVNIRAGVGKGYRAPNLKERYYVFDQGIYKVLGNEDLEPETSTSFQAGVELLIPKGGQAGLNVFYNEIQDLIQYELDPSTQVLPFYFGDYIYQNVERASTKGVEVTFSKPMSYWLNVNAAYTYLDARDDDTGKFLTLRPEHQVKASLDFYLPLNAMFTVKMNYESEQYADADNAAKSEGYTTWDLVLNQDLTQEWAWYAGINNMTDEQKDFTDSTDQRPSEGRYIYAGLKWQWQKD